jgi:hypothetical protein
MATLIILDRPDARHIPWFAMGVPSSLEDRAVDIDIEVGLDQNRIVGRRCLDWIRAHRGDNGIGLVATRNYIRPQTALYVNWLLFRDEPLATEFLDTLSALSVREKDRKTSTRKTIVDGAARTTIATRRVRPRPDRGERPLDRGNAIRRNT